MNGLTDYGKRVTDLYQRSWEEVVGIYAKQLGVNPPPKTPKHRLCQMVAEREAIYDRDGNLSNS